MVIHLVCLTFTLLPFSFPLPHPLSLYHQPCTLSFPTCCCSLQKKGFTALIYACERGYTACALALLRSPDINVNHANVSISELSRCDVLSPLNLENITHCGGKYYYPR